MRIRRTVEALTRWLRRCPEAEHLRRRANEEALRQEMDRHPVERDEVSDGASCSCEPRPKNQSRPPGSRRHLWRLEEEP
jgi:hypothetical protein